MAMKPSTPPPAMAMAPTTPMAGGATPAAVPTTVSMDLPPSIQQLIQAPTPGVNQSGLGNIPTGTTAANPNAAVLDFRQQPSYEEGGMIGPGGMPGVQLVFSLSKHKAVWLILRWLTCKLMTCSVRTQRLLLACELLLRQAYSLARCLSRNYKWPLSWLR